MDIALFGTGYRAARILRLLSTYKSEIKVVYCLDNFNQGTFRGYEIKKANKDNCTTYKTVITPSGDFCVSIKKQLESFGMIEGKDFWTYEGFVREVLQMIRRENLPQIRLSFFDFWEGFANSASELSWLEIALMVCDLIIDENNPQLTISSVFGSEALKRKNCVHILFSGENTLPNYDDYEYNIGFCSDEKGEKYFRWPLYYMYEKTWRIAVNKHNNVNMEEFLNRKFCCRVVSNDSFFPREEMFKQLDSRIKVDSGGRCLNNIGYIVDDKDEFISNYRFNIAMENSSSKGYVTEKIVQAYAAGCIPIYNGENMAEDFAEDSYVNVSKFSSLSEAVDYVIELNNDYDMMRKYLTVPILGKEMNEDEPYYRLANFLAECIRKM